MLGHGLKCEYSVGEAIGQLVIWLIISVLTLGLALFVLPYYFLKGPLNKTYVVDHNGDKRARLRVETNLGEIIGHAIIWLLLTIVTLGLAYLVYWPAVMKKMLSGVTYQELAPGLTRPSHAGGLINSNP